MMVGQKIMKRIKSLKPKDLGVAYTLATTLSVEKPHTLKHALYPEKIAVLVLLGAGNEKAAFPATYFNLKRSC
jgi:hypothetical protein